MVKQAKELLKLLIIEASKGKAIEADITVGNAALIAAQLGIKGFVKECIMSCPNIVFYLNSERQNIFLVAVKYRQQNIFNLLYQMGTNIHLVTSPIDVYGNHMLHLAAKLTPLKMIPGAALQLQRELQWFQEVEKVVQPSYNLGSNIKGKSPRMLFTEEHAQLVEEGEEWMKATASSFSTIAALILILVCVAAFTVPGPGGNDSAFFAIFAVSDALALFSSCTSLLMFTGILISRYAEEDFLKDLPMRLSMGLITLFFSISSMLIAFSAAFYLVLFQSVKLLDSSSNWLAPLSLFAFLYFPTLIHILYSTFGPKHFGQTK